MRTLGIAAGGLALVLALTAVSEPVRAQAPKYVGSDGAVRVALAKQPLSPNGPSKGPTTMADGGIQRILADLGATVRVDEARLTPLEETELAWSPGSSGQVRPSRRCASACCGSMRIRI